MIVGSGLIARAFARHFGANGEFCVFASGVSNSSEANAAPFHREEQILRDALATQSRLIYFSSCALINPGLSDTPYLAHKRRMEQTVLNASEGNLVLRLPQVVGDTKNPNTLTNFLYDRIRNAKTFTVWTKAERNLIDVDDVARIAAGIARDNQSDRIVTVAAQHSLTMPVIVEMFERVLQRKAIHTLSEHGDPLPVDSTICMYYAEKIGIDLRDGYAERVIRKYYAS